MSLKTYFKTSDFEKVKAVIKEVLLQVEKNKSIEKDRGYDYILNNYIKYLSYLYNYCFVFYRMIVSIYHCLIDYSLMSEKLSLLMVSFHFPPISQSSGYLRALKFAKYLPEYNVEPTILTVNLRAYKLIDLENSKLLNQLDNNIEIHKAQCWDSSKHFAIFGKYFSWLAMPDKWVSWIPFGIIKGWQLNKKKKFIDILDNSGIETRPIISGNFLNQPAIKLLKLNKQNQKFISITRSSG